MSHLQVDYKRFGNLEVLDKEDLQAIEIRAKVLDLDDCLAYLCLEQAELPEADAKAAKAVWRRGRMIALNNAGEQLFRAMEGKQGGMVAMDYLKQLNGTFQVEVDTTAKSGFSFNVVMPEK